MKRTLKALDYVERGTLEVVRHGSSSASTGLSRRDHHQLARGKPTWILSSQPSGIETRTVSSRSVFALTARVFGVAERDCEQAPFVTIASRSISPPSVQRVITRSSLDGLFIGGLACPPVVEGKLGSKNHFAEIDPILLRPGRCRALRRLAEPTSQINPLVLELPAIDA